MGRVGRVAESATLLVPEVNASAAGTLPRVAKVSTERSVLAEHENREAAGVPVVGREVPGPVDSS